MDLAIRIVGASMGALIGVLILHAIRVLIVFDDRRRALSAKESSHD